MIVFLTAYMGTPDAETARRMAVASQSWRGEWDRNPGVWRNPLLSFVRDSSEVGDPVPVPRVSDILAFGLLTAESDDDILVLANADVGITEGFTQRLINCLGCVPAVYLRRREFDRIDAPLKTRVEVKAGGQYVGGDAFAFTAGWWRKNAAIVPILYLGRIGWDSLFKNMIRRAGGAEMVNELWHQSHDSYWNSSPEVIDKNPANAWNRRALEEWIATYGGSPEDHIFTHAELNYR